MTKTKHLKFIILIASALLIIFLPACTQKPSESTTEGPANGKRNPEELTLWVYFSSDEEMAVLESVVSEWEAQTGDQVEVIQYPYFEMLSKVEVSFPAGKGPDLIEYPHTNAGVWSQAHLIAPFPKGVLSETEAANYQTSALSAFTTDGQLYGIPQISDMVVLMYNKDLVTTPPTTMEELKIMAHELTTDNIYGFLMLDNNMWFGWGFISGYGGYIFGEKDGIYNPNDIGIFSKNTADGLDYLMTFRKIEKLIPSDVDWNVLTGMFTEGKVAMMFMNANQAGIYEEAGIRVGMAVMPQLPNGQMPAPLMNLHGWGLNAYSKKQQAAAELAVFLGAKLPVPLFQASAGNIPVRKDVMSDPVIANDPNANATAQQVEFGQPVPNIPEMGLAWTPIDNAFKLVATGEINTAQALMEAAQALREAIASQE